MDCQKEVQKFIKRFNNQNGVTGVGFNSDQGKVFIYTDSESFKIKVEKQLSDRELDYVKIMVIKDE